MAFDFLLFVRLSDEVEDEAEEAEMLTSASFEKSVSELTSRADFRDSRRRTSSIFLRSVSSWNWKLIIFDWIFIIYLYYYCITVKWASITDVVVLGVKDFVIIVLRTKKNMPRRFGERVRNCPCDVIYGRPQIHPKCYVKKVRNKIAS